MGIGRGGLCVCVCVSDGRGVLKCCVVARPQTPARGHSTSAVSLPVPLFLTNTPSVSMVHGPVSPLACGQEEEGNQLQSGLLSCSVYLGEFVLRRGARASAEIQGPSPWLQGVCRRCWRCRVLHGRLNSGTSFKLDAARAGAQAPSDARAPLIQRSTPCARQGASVGGWGGLDSRNSAPRRQHTHLRATPQGAVRAPQPAPR